MRALLIALAVSIPAHTGWSSPTRARSTTSTCSAPA